MKEVQKYNILLTGGFGMHLRGGGGIWSGAARYDGGEYRPDGKHPGAVMGAPWSPLLPIILSGEYIILDLIYIFSLSPKHQQQQQ